MFRRILTTFLFLAIGSQPAVFMGEVSVSIHAGQDPVHYLMHMDGDAHHHDDTGSYVQDDSPESIQHIMADAGGHVLAIATAETSIPASVANSLPRVLPEHAPFQPYLDGPRRPPRRKLL